MEIRFKEAIREEMVKSYYIVKLAITVQSCHTLSSHLLRKPKIIAVPDQLHDEYERRPINPIDYNGICQASVMLSVIVPDKISQLAALFCSILFNGICDRGS